MGRDNQKRRQPSTDQLSHTEASGLLYAYAHEILMGGATESDYAAVAAHVMECASCRSDLDELLEVSQVMAAASGTPASDCPQPNLVRLPRPWAQTNTESTPWFIDRLGRFWLTFSTELLRSWQPPLLAGAARGNVLYEYSNEDAGGSAAQERRDSAVSCKLQIKAEPDPRTAVLSIMLDVPTPDALDQAGVPVILHSDGTQERRETDSSGMVVFPHIPREALPRLVLEIKVGQSA